MIRIVDETGNGVQKAMPLSVNLVNKLIVFICCLTAYVCQKNSGIDVSVALIGIIFSGFLSYFDDDRLKTILTVGFSILCCFVPELTVFLPLIAYDMLFCKYQYYNLFSIVPLLYYQQSTSLPAFLVVIILLSLCILVKYRTEAQIKLRESYNKLSDAAREMSMKLKKQNAELIEKRDNELSLAALNERNRIAREIHDNVGHLLSSAILQSGALLTVNRDENVKQNLEILNKTLSQAMDSIKASVHELYDESIDLNAQIESIVKQFTFCEISYDYQIDSNPGKKLKYAFILTVKEALSNIMMHSNATHASITLREHPALYQLVIRDNGTVGGYSADDGMGLRSMTDRVQSLNGNINISTKNGFEIFISVPKEGLT